MADIKLRIELNADGSSEKLGTTTTDNIITTNTSLPLQEGNVMVMPDGEFNGSNGLSWGSGYLSFTENGMLCNPDDVETGKGGVLESEQNPKEFIWGVVPQNKEYSVRLTFADAVNLEQVVVFGDKESQQFPTEAIIDGTTTIFSDDYKWVIDLGQPSDTHTIEFTKWNRANYNAVLSLIRVMLQYLEVDKFNGLKSVESLSQSTGQPKEIFYGVIPSSGSIEIIDLNGEIEDMVKDGIMPNSNVKVEVFANGNKVQEHITQDSNYNEKVLNIDLKNSLSEWEKIKIKPQKFKSFNDTYYHILEDILMQSGYRQEQVSNMCDNTMRVTFKEGSRTSGWLNKNMTVGAYLASLNVGIHEAFTRANTLRDFVDEICKITQLVVYENSNGDIKFASSRPISTYESRPIVIPQKIIIGVPEKELLPKNNFDNIAIKKNILSKSVSKFYNQEYYIRDENENILLSVLGENAEIKDFYNGQNFLCFFKTIKGILDMLRLENIYGVDFSVSLTFKDKERNIIGEYGAGAFNTSSETKENFDFESSGIATVLTSYSGINQETLAIKFPLSGVVNNTLSSVYYIDVSIWGYNMALSQLDYLANSNKKIYEYGENGSLINDESEFTFYFPENQPGYSNDWVASDSIYNLIEQNLLDDYKNGVETANITISCQNLYYEGSTSIAKDWSNGEVLEIGDIVRIDKHNFYDIWQSPLDSVGMIGDSLWKDKNGNTMYWKVVGRKFKKVGVPLIDLELQQVIPDEVTSVVISDESITTTQGSGYTLTLWCYSKNAKIYYTTDGTEPNINSLRYYGPFNVVSNTQQIITIRAIAIDENIKSPSETRASFWVGN